MATNLKKRKTTEKIEPELAPPAPKRQAKEMADVEVELDAPTEDWRLTMAWRGHAQPFSVDELGFVAGPLLTLPIEKWHTVEDAIQRSDCIRDMFAGTKDKKLPRFAPFLSFLADVERYGQYWNCSSTNPRYNVKVSTVIEPIRRLVKTGKPWSKWTRDDVLPVVDAFRGILSFYARDDPARDEFTGFYLDWCEYLAENPAIMKLLDPWIVTAGVGGAVLPAAYPAAVLAFPPGGGPPLPAASLSAVPAGGGPPVGYQWSFLDKSRATQFIGHMQAQVPGLKLTLASGAAPIVVRLFPPTWPL